VNARGFSALSKLVSRASGRVIPESKPVTGEAAFLHESGIHCAGLMRDRKTYEPFASSDIGRHAPPFIIGRHTGSAALAGACRNAGLRLEARDLNALLEKVRKRSREIKAPLSSGQLAALILKYAA